MSDKSSDGISWPKAILMFIAGSLLIFVAGAIYGFMANGYFYTRLFSPFAYYAATFYIARLCAGYADKTGFSVWRLLYGVWFGLFALYIGWAFWVYVLKGQPFFNLSELWAAINNIAETGYRVTERRGGGHMVAGGRSLVVYWILDAICLLGASIAGALALSD